MLRLGKEELKNKKDHFEKVDIKTPGYPFEKVWEATKREPVWLHIGGGNLFRAFHSVLQHHLIELKEADKGIIVVSTSNDGKIEKAYHPYDNLCLDVTMKVDGTLDMEVIASVAESITADPKTSSWKRLKEIFRNPSLQFITLTITEKGYNLKDIDGKIQGSIQKEIEQGLDNPKHTMVILTALLFERYQNGKVPLALVSTDNFSHNGDKLKEAVMTVASMWKEMNTVDQGFIEYLKDENVITFPWSMIDKITPHPSLDVQEKLKEIGFGSIDLIQTRKNGPTIAPFVNTEESEYLVIEDSFPNGRPSLEKVGVYFTEREVVDRVERMKVCTCLNPLHTALAIFGCLLNYTSIAAEMKDGDLKALVEKIGYVEGMKVVVDPGIIDPREFLKEVIEIRFANPNNPDTPQRIATDTSQKLSIRFGETLKLYVERDDLDVNNLTFIPLTIAAWCRYLMGINDDGEVFTLSPDPLLEEVQQHIQKIEFGNPNSVHNHLKPILTNAQIFGVDLYEIGLGGKVEEFFKLLIKAPGAVRTTLHNMVRMP
ncbi:mannitol dehydrogenase family protein [Priestia endophytica]|jgi:fructuronate reductase|uniref:mannitol dehydrogenase family protein n=1 Tax=Priestia endophytica TaxID=135735 RepID=UPI000F53EB4E|nr:mannitol dehydrogenase family protein [Priestia endophytica]RPK10689.1 D-mannonate oxidoreductase [Priestia endophytica]